MRPDGQPVRSTGPIKTILDRSLEGSPFKTMIPAGSKVLQAGYMGRRGELHMLIYAPIESCKASKDVDPVEIRDATLIMGRSLQEFKKESIKYLLNRDGSAVADLGNAFMNFSNHRLK